MAFNEAGLLTGKCEKEEAGRSKPYGGHVLLALRSSCNQQPLDIARLHVRVHAGHRGFCYRPGWMPTRR